MLINYLFIKIQYNWLTSHATDNNNLSLQRLTENNDYRYNTAK